MPEPATTENWKSVPPVPDFRKPWGLQDLYVPDALGGDDLHYMKMREGLTARALWISPSTNMWCNILKGRGGGLINRHYHPTDVWAYTLSGKWGYLEHDWTARAGDFVYEPPGGSHTLVMYDCGDEPTAVLFLQRMPLIWIDEDGHPSGAVDVFEVIERLEKHYAATPLGRDYVKTLIR